MHSTGRTVMNDPCELAYWCRGRRQPSSCSLYLTLNTLNTNMWKVQEVERTCSRGPPCTFHGIVPHTCLCRGRQQRHQIPCDGGGGGGELGRLRQRHHQQPHRARRQWVLQARVLAGPWRVAVTLEALEPGLWGGWSRGSGGVMCARSAPKASSGVQSLDAHSSREKGWHSAPHTSIYTGRASAGASLVRWAWARARFEARIPPRRAAHPPAWT